MPTTSEPLPLPEAQALVRRRVGALAPLPVEQVAAREASGRVLASALAAPRDVPGFAHSAMDGYAVRAADLAPDAPTALTEIGAMLAGGTARHSIRPGECVRITTGAPLPEGADTVVIKENARRDGATIVVEPAARGANVRGADDDYVAGDAALAAGTRLAAPQLSVAAELGLATLEVVRRPRVAIVVSGDELVAPGRALGFGQRYESNGALLKSLATAHGCELVERQHVRDDPAATRAALERAASLADVVFTSGGVSAGEADHLPAAIAALGEVVFWKVRMRPGMPALFGLIGATSVLALPGNPVSVFATFLALVRPALAVRARCAALDPPPVFARLAAPAEKRHARLELRRATLEYGRDAALVARLHPKLSSGAMRSVAESDALAELAAERERFDAGEIVPVHRFALG